MYRYRDALSAASEAFPAGEQLAKKRPFKSHSQPRPPQAPAASF
jgi:hypothetical protein